ncbi:Site-specific DNA methylase, partial [human gut metagenome]
MTGSGVFPLAASRCGIRPLWASEIEAAPISITRRHFPDMAHLGDITKLD